MVSEAGQCEIFIRFIQFFESIEDSALESDALKAGIGKFLAEVTDLFLHSFVADCFALPHVLNERVDGLLIEAAPDR